MKSEKEIHTLRDFVDIVTDWEETNAPPEGVHWNWYRGQPNAEDDPLPSVLRKRFLDQAEDLFAGFHNNERGLELERKLNTEFLRQAASFLDDRTDFTHIYFLAQHYGLPTRLLDWTTNPLVALFFAVTSDKDDKDGRVFVHKFGHLSRKHPPTHQRDEIVENAIRYLFSRSTDKAPEPEILTVQLELVFPRMLHQSACFTLHLPGCEELDFKKDDEAGSHSPTAYLIPKSAKTGISRELRKFGVTRSNLFPELPSIASDIMATYGL